MKKRKNKKGFLIGGIAAGAVVILAGEEFWHGNC